MNLEQQNEILISNFQLTKENKRLNEVCKFYRDNESTMYEELRQYVDFGCNDDFKSMIEKTKVELWRQDEEIKLLKKSLN